jgi:hypothetical protein
MAENGIRTEHYEALGLRRFSVNRILEVIFKRCGYDSYAEEELLNGREYRFKIKDSGIQVILDDYPYLSLLDNVPSNKVHFKMRIAGNDGTKKMEYIRQILSRRGFVSGR